MNNLLDPILRAEGLDDAAIERVHAALRRQDAYVTVNYEAQYRRQRAAETARAAEAAKAMPDYHGAITRCQAQVAYDRGLTTEFDRCSFKPTKVRPLARDDRKGHTGSGFLAVCGTHARVKYGIQRWVKGDHWSDRGKVGTADEAIEPEYLP